MSYASDGRRAGAEVIPSHVRSLAKRLAVAPWDDLERIEKEFEKLSVERRVVDELIAASNQKKGESDELQELLLDSAQHRTDGREEEAMWVLFGPLRAYLIRGVLEGNADPSRRAAWDRISAILAVTAQAGDRAEREAEGMMDWTLEVTRKGERHTTQLGRFHSMEEAVAEAERRSPDGLHWTQLQRGRLGVAGNCQYLVLKAPI
ncbi:MAG: hypothetical protein WKF55_04810 [Gemmatimonadaceae bacterium]